jgi:O-antigen/teichoic acid export membrane protein
LVQNKVGHQDYGVYTALYSFGFLFISLSDLGITYFFTREVASDNNLLKKYTATVLPFKVVISVLYPFVFTAIGLLLGYNSYELTLLFLACFTHSLLNLVSFYRAQFQAFQEFNTDSMFSILDKFLLVFFVMLMYYFYEITLLNFVYLRLASSIITTVLAFIISAKLFGFLNIKIDFSLLKYILKKSFPFALIGILYSFNDKVDQVILERISGGHQTGLYAAAYRWVDVIMMFLWTLLPILFARFSKFRSDKPELENTFQIGQIIAAIPIIYVSSFMMVNAEKMFFLFTNSNLTDYKTMSDLLKILFASVMLNGIFSIYSTLLNSTGSEKWVSVLIGISVFLNIALNLVFVPVYGPYSCAYVTLVSTLFLSVGYLFILVKYSEYSIKLAQLYKLLSFSILFCTVYYYSFIFISDFIIGNIVGLLLFIFLFFVFRIVELNKIKAFLKSCFKS